MKQAARQRKHTTTVFKALRGHDWLTGHLAHFLQEGKQSFERFLHELGGMLAETIMELDQEEQVRSDYQPKIPGVYKWAANRVPSLLGIRGCRSCVPAYGGPMGSAPCRRMQS